MRSVPITSPQWKFRYSRPYVQQAGPAMDKGVVMISREMADQFWPSQN